jgi:hypothetical protein
MAPLAVIGSILGFAGKNFAKIVVGGATGASNVLINGAKNVVGAFFSLVNPISMIKNGLNELQKFDEMGVKTSRQIGLNYGSSVAYTGTLIRRTKDLAAVYGVTSEAIGQIQENLSKATGKAIMFNDAQAEIAVAANRTIGESAMSQFYEEYQKFGGSVQGAMDLAVDSYTQATRMGLSAQEYSAKVAQNIKMANQYKFADGVNGIMKMTALSEKLGFNLQSMGSVIDKFNTIQGSIESSANLQMLGGMGAAYGSNPMTMLYESLNDPEALTKRMTDIFGSLGTFNTKTGMSELTGYNMALIKEQAKAMGMNPEEAVQIAKSSAKVKFVDQQAGGALSHLTEEQKAFVENKAQYDTKTGQFTITDVSGKTKEISQMTPEEVMALQKQESMTDREAFMSGAQQIVSVSERIEGIQAMIGAQLAETLFPMLDGFKSLISRLIPSITNLVANGISVSVGLLKMMVSGIKILTNSRFWTGLAKVMIQGISAGAAVVAQWSVMALLGWFGVAIQGILSSLAVIGKLFGADKKTQNTLDKISGLASGITLGKKVYDGVGSLLDKMGLKGWDSKDARGEELRGDFRTFKDETGQTFKAATSIVGDAITIGKEVMVFGKQAVDRMGATGEERKAGFNKAIADAQNKDESKVKVVYDNVGAMQSAGNTPRRRGLGTYNSSYSTNYNSTAWTDASMSESSRTGDVNSNYNSDSDKATTAVREDIKTGSSSVVDAINRQTTIIENLNDRTTVIKNGTTGVRHTKITVKPVGEPTYFADPRSKENVSPINSGKMEFGNINVNVSGDINLKGTDGKLSNIDMDAIKKELERSLTASIRENMNKQANMGMTNKNVSYIRGVGIDSGHRTA